MTRLQIRILTSISILLTIIAIGSISDVAYADEVVKVGSFKGASGHVTSGDVEIVRRDDGSYYVHLLPNFKSDGAPDPYLGFGNLSFDRKTEFTELFKDNGEQTYDIPSSINPLDYVRFIVWCKAYSVNIGVAVLSRKKK